ncbi:TauD/TfdA family dioxygenase [Iodidimonas sp. SYSU 1G8]|uniref:TauD/TfdA dioxygenase family protein n=1 Tax=Iodidimonas sp. SYSU 1G8 TaxID=3133967 RepID=UPI0031FEEEC2
MSIEIEPLGAAAGARIHGVDLSQPLDEADFARVRRALLDHLVIFFPDQHLSPDEHKAFGLRFGTLNIHPHVKPLDGHPEVLNIVKEPDDRLNFGGGWHSDMSFLDKPVLGSILYAREIPRTGGDTMWANMCLAYDALSTGMKQMLAGLTAIHTAEDIYGAQGIYNNDDRRSMRTQAAEQASGRAEHPVVRTHPETGRKLLFVNEAFTTKFKGMTRAESRPLLDFLCQHATSAPFVYRHRWTENEVAFWDNRCTQHFALNDYAGQRRVMHRVTVNGDRPY